MKCPKCSFITSNRNDVCPRCTFDLRSRKKELGIRIMKPNASLADLVAGLEEQPAVIRETAAPEPEGVSQSDQPRRSFLDRIFRIGSKRADSLTQQSEIPQPSETPASSEFETEGEGSAEDGHEDDFDMPGEEPAPEFDAAEDGSFDDEPLHRQEPPADLSAAEHEEESDVFQLLNTLHTPAEEFSESIAGSFGKRPAGAPTASSAKNPPPSYSTPTVGPKVLEFGDDMDLDGALDALLGEMPEEMTTEAVPVTRSERAQPAGNWKSFGEEDFEFEVEFEGDGEQLVEEQPAESFDLFGAAAPEAESGDGDSFLNELVSNLQSLESQAAQHSILDRPAAAQPKPPANDPNRVQALQRAQEVMARLGGVDQNILGELSQVLADAYGLRPETFVPPPARPELEFEVANRDEVLERAKIREKLAKFSPAPKAEASKSQELLSLEARLTGEMQALVAGGTNFFSVNELLGGNPPASQESFPEPQPTVSASEEQLLAVESELLAELAAIQAETPEKKPEIPPAELEIVEENITFPPAHSVLSSAHRIKTAMESPTPNASPAVGALSSTEMLLSSELDALLGLPPSEGPQKAPPLLQELAEPDQTLGMFEEADALQSLLLAAEAQESTGPAESLTAANDDSASPELLLTEELDTLLGAPEGEFEPASPALDSPPAVPAQESQTIEPPLLQELAEPDRTLEMFEAADGLNSLLLSSEDGENIGASEPPAAANETPPADNDTPAPELLLTEELDALLGAPEVAFEPASPASDSPPAVPAQASQTIDRPVELPHGETEQKTAAEAQEPAPPAKDDTPSAHPAEVSAPDETLLAAELEELLHAETAPEDLFPAPFPEPGAASANTEASKQLPEPVSSQEAVADLLIEVATENPDLPMSPASETGASAQTLLIDELDSLLKAQGEPETPVSAVPAEIPNSPAHAAPALLSQELDSLLAALDDPGLNLQQEPDRTLEEFLEDEESVELNEPNQPAAPEPIQPVIPQPVIQAVTGPLPTDSQKLLAIELDSLLNAGPVEPFETPPVPAQLPEEGELEALIAAAEISAELPDELSVEGAVIEEAAEEELPPAAEDEKPIEDFLMQEEDILARLTTLPPAPQPPTPLNPPTALVRGDGNTKRRSELWEKAFAEVAAAEAQNGPREIHISAGEVSTLVQSARTDVLFQSAAEELVDPIKRMRRIEAMNSGVRRRVDSRDLETAVLVYQREERAYRTKQAERRMRPARTLAEITLGSIPARLIALVIDLVVIFGAAVVISLLCIYPASVRSSLLLLQAPSLDDMLPALMPSVNFAFILWIVTRTMFTLVYGSGIGGRLMKLEVVDYEGRAVGPKQAFLRTCAELITVLTLGISLLPGLWKTRRTLHDFLAKTLVSVRRELRPHEKLKARVVAQQHRPAPKGAKKKSVRPGAKPAKRKAPAPQRRTPPPPRPKR